jgi:hypothetical protein
MDIDTIFPNLSHGEEILGKYQHSECWKVVETTSILTNFRLLIRWTETFFCCCHRSHYSAITLNSIFRIDETRPSRYWLIISLILFTAGIAMTIVGAIGKNYAIMSVGIVGIIFTVLCLVWYFLLLQYKFVTLKGSFGSQTLKFEKSIAREFESRLSEMVHIIQMKRTNEQINTQELLPPPTATTFSVQNELKYYSTEKEHRPDTPTSNVQSGMK